MSVLSFKLLVITLLKCNFQTPPQNLAKSTEHKGTVCERSFIWLVSVEI